MPKHPIYVAMLSEGARSVIGLPHPNGRAAMRMLENEGFSYENYIDIFDGGPTMTARIDHVKTVRDARDFELTGVADGGLPSLIATGRLADFRVTLGQVGDGTIDPASAAALGVAVGDVLTEAER